MSDTVNNKFDEVNTHRYALENKFLRTQFLSQKPGLQDSCSAKKKKIDVPTSSVLDKSNVLSTRIATNIFSSCQPSSETFHDLSRMNIIAPIASGAKSNVLSSLPPSSKSAEMKNKEILQNNCNREMVRVKRRFDWAECEYVTKKRARTTVINFTVPKLLQFVNMFDEFYVDKLLDYELHYNRLPLLRNIIGVITDSDEEASEYSDEEASEYSDEEASEYSDEEVIESYETYSLIVNILMNGDKEKAVLKLESLLDKIEMPSAQYAFAIIKLRELKDKAVKLEEDKKLRFQTSEVIKWLKGDYLDGYLRPLNWSLLLKVQKYNIGELSERVTHMTGLTMEKLLYKILSTSKDLGIEFSDKLVRVGCLCKTGDIIATCEKRKNDARFFVQCAMYELLKLKISEPDLRGEYIDIEDAFVKISEILPHEKCYAHIFEYIHAEIMFGHAIYLLGHKLGKKDAVALLNRSCKLKHPGALYLRGVLLSNRKDYGFIARDDQQYEKCLNGLKYFSEKYRNETAACIVANEYLRSDRLVRVRSEEQAKRIAHEVLTKSECDYIWEEFCSKIPSN